MNVKQGAINRSIIRKNNMKKKKVLKVVYYFLIFSLIFVIGIGSGMLYGFNSVSNNVEDVVNVEDDGSQEESDADLQEKIVDKNQIENERLEALKNKMVSIMKEKYPSVEVSLLIKNLDTGAMVSHNNKKMNSASIIKLFILETVYDELAKGNYDLTDEKKRELEIMITESNNNAANLFIDDFGGENEKRKITEENKINVNIKESGYVVTELNRKMHDTTPPGGPSGYQNYSSPEDVCKFLEGIYSKTLLEEPYNTQTLGFLKKQQRRAKIPAKIVDKYSDVVVANKTGELSQIENDAAIIMSDDFNLVFVIMTDGIPFKADGSTDYDLKEDVQATISDFGLMLVDMYKENNFGA